MRLYKLTGNNNYTMYNTRWGKHKELNLQPCENPRLCSKDVIHAYTSLSLGLLLNPIHSGFDPPNIWEAEGSVVVKDYGKVGCFKLKTTKRLRKPAWYTNQKERKRVQILFAILCAESVLHKFETSFTGDNRPRQAIDAAKEYLKTNAVDTDAYAYACACAADAADAADTDAYAYAYYVADAADAAADVADAADAAADAAYAAYAAYAARAAAYAAYAARAARAATRAADAADAAACAACAAEGKIDFVKLADKAAKTIMDE